MPFSKSHSLARLVTPTLRAPRRPTLLASLTTIAVVRLALRARGLSWTLRTIEQRTGQMAFASAAAADDNYVAATSSRVALAAALFPGRALCLERSLTLLYFLRRAGLPAALRFGVHVHPFSAHAWIELFGQAVDEPADMLASMTHLPTPQQ
jgi:hypothetical protein